MDLLDAFAATADPDLWQRYCRLAAALEKAAVQSAAPIAAIGSVEWQREGEPAAPEPRLRPELEEAGRRRLARRGQPLPFAGAVSPLGAAVSATFEEFVTRRRGPIAIESELAAIEQRLVRQFEALGRDGRYRISGFCAGAEREIDPAWLGRVRLDFAGNRVVLPDGAEFAAATVTLAPATASPPGRERSARARLRATLVALWEKGAFTASTGNERVLALALQELGLNPADPPYGFKSAETVRKLRKALGMSF